MHFISKKSVGKLLLGSVMASVAATVSAAVDNKAYGILAFSDDQYRHTNNVVTFDLVSEAEPVFTTAVPIAETSTAGAFGNGFYYIATTRKEDTREVPDALIKVNLTSGTTSTVGHLDGYYRHINDMTFDHSTSSMYAVSVNADNQSMLYTIDLSTARSTTVATLDRRFFTLASSYAGQLYGISFAGEFCAIDKATGAVTLIGHTGHYPQNFQTMEFDHAANTLYWIASTRKLNESGTIEVPESFVATIDLATGAAIRHQEFGDNQLAGLYIPSFIAADNCPAPVTAPTATPAAGGELKATLTWVNPTKTFGGETLKAISRVEIKRDGEPVGSVSAAEPGKQSTYVDNLPAADLGAFHTWTITAYNNNGAGAPVEISVFVGRDLPAAVSAVNVEKTGPNSARISWNAVTAGANGGWTDTDGLTYTLVRQPGNVTLAEGLTATEWLEPGVEVSNTYTYTVTARNSCGASAPTTSAPVILGPKLGIPYTCGFDEDFGQWTPVDANEDGNTWERFTLSWAKVTGAYFQSVNFPGDDWLVSNAIEFEPNSTYKVTMVGIGNQHPLTFYLLRDSDIANPLQKIGELTMQSNWAVNSHEFQFTTGNEAGDLNLAIHDGADKGDSFIVIDRIDVEKIADNNLAATSIIGNIKPIEGNTYGYSVSVINKGGHTYSTFNIELLDAQGNVLASNTFNDDIRPAGSKSFTVDYTIPMGCTLTAIYGRVKAEGDEIEADNTTPALAITVLPLGSPEELPIGSKVSTSNYHPMNLYSKYGASLNIYSAEELSVKSGRITGIKYEYNSSYYSANNVGLKIYLANTDRTDNNAGWIAEDELTLVYEGHFNVEEGSHTPEFTFDRAFDYDGSNLALLTVTSMADADRAYISGVYQPYYTSPLSGNQVLVYGNDRTEFDFTGNGTKRTGNSVITLMMQSGGASISGTVSDGDGNPVEGATVKLAEIRAEATTNADGSYRFDFVPNDTYTLSASMFGYSAPEPQTITVNDNNVVADFTLTKLPAYTVSGRAVAADGTPLAGTAIRLSGYADLVATTEADGTFGFTGVVTAADNTLTASKPWYVGASRQFALEADTDLGDITLGYAHFAPVNAAATPADAAEISWQNPGQTATLRFDSGVPSTQIGFSDASTGTIVIGTAFRSPMTLNSISWYTTSEGGPHYYVNVFVYDLDADGNPTGTILGTYQAVKNTDNEWSTLELPEPIEAPRGCFIGVNYAGFLALGVDNAAKSHPVQSNTYAFSIDFNSGDFMYFTDEALSGNLMLRAGASLYSAEGEPCGPADELPSFYRYSVSRTLGYDATEGTLLTAEPTAETALTDADWASLPAGVYRYAVSTVYPDGSQSAPVFTDYIPRDMRGSLKLTVHTNSHSANPDGAKVTLTAADDDAATLTAVVGENGSVEFANVWRTGYLLNIALPGYEFAELPLSLLDNKDLVLSDLVLKEIIATPVNAAISLNSEEGEARFTWNESGEIFDGFEDHTPFTVASAGEVGWQYRDDDGARTFAEPEFNFPGRTQPCSFMVFNPWLTTPDMASQRSVSLPRTGKAELACFAGFTGSDDWFISPRLTYHSDFTFSFYARGYSQTYGEVIRVGYSTTNTMPYSFDWLSEEIDVVKQEWTKYEFTVPAEAKYVAVHCVSPDGFILFIDDVEISSGNNYPMNTAVTGPEVKYEVTLDGEVVGETTDCEFTFYDLAADVHTASVKAVYASGESDAVEFTFGQDGIADVEAAGGDITVGPNPARDFTVINGEFTAARLIDMSGRCVATFGGDNQRLDLRAIARGFYILSIDAANGTTVNVKLTVR